MKRIKPKNDIGSKFAPVIRANYAIKQQIDYLIDKYDLTQEEKDSLAISQEHLINLNVMFNKMK
jgi:hypothetical protein